VREFEIELEIGDVLRIGEYSITLLDIDGKTVCVRIDGEEDWLESPQFQDGMLGV